LRYKYLKEDQKSATLCTNKIACGPTRHRHKTSLPPCFLHARREERSSVCAQPGADGWQWPDLPENKVGAGEPDCRNNRGGGEDGRWLREMVQRWPWMSRSSQRRRLCVHGGPCSSVEPERREVAWGDCRGARELLKGAA
jgi:hypothetical protein